MAVIYPFSRQTRERLEEMPEPGGTHRWLAQVASGLSSVLTAEVCFGFLRRCCNELVGHREVPDRELAAAVKLAYGDRALGVNYGRGALRWPDANAEAIGKVLDEVTPCFDGEASTGLRPADVLPSLFDEGDLVCTGRASDRASVRTRDEAMTDADLLQFVVVNPMKGPWALNREGKQAVRCQANVMVRRHIVAEFDDPDLTKRMQAQLATALGDMAPLVMAVDSGGKSVHAWYRVDGMNARDQARFFAVACLLGADPTRWDVCGWLRMPGGLRVVEGVPRVRQRILYFSEAAAGKRGAA